MILCIGELNNVKADSMKILKAGKLNFHVETNRLVDDTIRKSWKELKCVPPLGIDEFVEQQSSFKDTKFFQLSDIGNWNHLYMRERAPSKAQKC